MAIEVSKQTGHVVLTPADGGVVVSKQTGHVALLADGLRISKMVGFVVLLPYETDSRRRMSLM